MLKQKHFVSDLFDLKKDSFIKISKQGYKRRKNIKEA
jgi:hypothetical protein